MWVFCSLMQNNCRWKSHMIQSIISRVLYAQLNSIAKLDSDLTPKLHFLIYPFATYWDADLLLQVCLFYIHGCRTPADNIVIWYNQLHLERDKHNLALQSFEGPRLNFLIREDKRSFLQTKTVRLPITKEILLKITRYQPTDGDKLNIHVFFKVAWVRFMQIGIMTFTAAEREAPTFKDTKLARTDISFFEFD